MKGKEDFVVYGTIAILIGLIIANRCSILPFDKESKQNRTLRNSVIRLAIVSGLDPRNGEMITSYRKDKQKQLTAQSAVKDAFALLNSDGADEQSVNSAKLKVLKLHADFVSSDITFVLFSLRQSGVKATQMGGYPEALKKINSMNDVLYKRHTIGSVKNSDVKRYEDLVARVWSKIK